MIIVETVSYILLIVCATLLLVFNVLYHKQAVKGERLLSLHISPALQKLSKIDLYLSWFLIGAITLFMVIHFFTSF
jgi:hypothetical protein